MAIPAGVFLLAQKLHEANDMTSSDVCRWLSDALRDMDGWCYYIDHIGDGESGDVIYSSGGDLQMAPYSIEAGGAVIDATAAVDVLPHTTYEPEAEDEGAHYAAMESAKLYQSGTARFVERNVSAGEREKMDSADFAGKGKSYPINKAADVMAAVRSIGRAGSDNYDAATLKKNIIRIAKRKGFEGSLPKSWRGGASKESQSSAENGQLKLVESAATIEPIVLREARADYAIKLIGPGKGATGYYTQDVIKRACEANVWKPETKVYLNHPGPQEESGGNRDVKRLAGVLTQPARWLESGPKGPGAYSRFKVFQDHAEMLDDKAPYLDMSILANGSQAMEAGRKVYREGVPLIAEITSAESVDIVPEGGAGGTILTEAARAAESQQEGGDMTLQEAQKLINEGIAAATAPLLERALKGDAREEGARILESVTLPAAAKTRIIERCLVNLPTKDGTLDIEKFRESVVRESKSEGEYLASITGSGRVVGMGTGDRTVLTEAQQEEQRLREKRERKAAKRNAEAAVDIFESLGMPKSAAAKAAGEAA